MPPTRKPTGNRSCLELLQNDLLLKFFPLHCPNARGHGAGYAGTLAFNRIFMGGGGAGSTFSGSQLNGTVTTLPANGTCTVIVQGTATTNSSGATNTVILSIPPGISDTVPGGLDDWPVTKHHATDRRGHSHLAFGRRDCDHAGVYGDGDGAVAATQSVNQALPARGRRCR